MLAMVWVVHIGSITRTSACMTARSTFSCGIAENGKATARRPARSRRIMRSPRSKTRAQRMRRAAIALENESARFCVRIERPDRPFYLGIGHLGRITLQRSVGIDVDHLL